MRRRWCPGMSAAQPSNEKPGHDHSANDGHQIASETDSRTASVGMQMRNVARLIESRVLSAASIGLRTMCRMTTNVVLALH